MEPGCAENRLQVRARRSAASLPSGTQRCTASYDDPGNLGLAHVGPGNIAQELQPRSGCAMPPGPTCSRPPSQAGASALALHLQGHDGRLLRLLRPHELSGAMSRFGSGVGLRHRLARGVTASGPHPLAAVLRGKEARRGAAQRHLSVFVTFCFLDVVGFGDLGGPWEPENHPERWGGAKQPTFLDCFFLGPRGPPRAQKQKIP